MVLLRLLDRALSAVVIAAIRCYQRFISPVLPPVCRYTPSCSRYALEAIRKKGFLVGTLLGAWRLLRCNPLFRGGYDPVK